MIHSSTQDGYPINIPSIFHGYKVIRRLGCGSTCVVFLIEDENTHEQFSAKIIAVKDAAKRNMIKSVVNEVNILKTIKHQNIIKIKEAFDIKDEKEEEYYVIVLEYCPNGDLLSYVTREGFKSEFEKREILEGILKAVMYLHKNGISHGDIKSENVLLDKNYTPKLCDFGFSRTKITAGEESKNGTLYYAAPELFLKGHFNTLKTDIYAIGIMLYSISELQFPFKYGEPESIVKQIIGGELSIRKGIDLHLRNLIEKCTKKNPQNRPSIEDILLDEYFTGNKMSEITDKACSRKESNIEKSSQKVVMSIC